MSADTAALSPLDNLRRARAMAVEGVAKIIWAAQQDPAQARAEKHIEHLTSERDHMHALCKQVKVSIHEPEAMEIALEIKAAFDVGVRELEQILHGGA